MTHVQEVARWLELRASGLTYRAIAQDSDYSYETVRRRVARYLEEHPVENAAVFRQTQLAGYDRLLRALSPGIDAGDVKAIGETRKILESQARLLGLNAAVKSELTVEVREDPAILQRIEAQRVANAAAREALRAAPLPLTTGAVIDVEVVES